MRSFLIGFFSGLVLSALRAPLGLELLQVPATIPSAAMAYRAGALLVIGMGLVLGMRRGHASHSPTLLLAGGTVGYQCHWQLVDTPDAFLVQMVFSLLLVSLLVAGHRGGADQRPHKGKILALALAALVGWWLLDQGHPESHSAAIATALAGSFCLIVTGKLTFDGRPAAESSSDSDSEPPATTQGTPVAPSGGLTGIALCGAGLAIMAEGLARHVRWLSNGNLEDDSVFGSVFLALCAMGALSFARMFKGDRASVMARGCLAAAGGLGAWAGFQVLQNFASPRGLDLYVRQFKRFDLNWDLAIQGLFEYDLIIAAPVFVVSAFLIGTSIGVHRRAIELCALLVGAGAGLVLCPALLEYEWKVVDHAQAELVNQSNSANMALFGGLIAAIGGLLVFLTASSLPKGMRLAGCVVAFAGIAICRFPQQSSIQILSPWQRREVQPIWVLDGPEGLLTVERDDQGGEIATLDRRPLTPNQSQSAADRRRLVQSVQLLGEREEGSELSLLFVGQLTPDRALALSDLGATRIDRTASWSASMGALESRLFGSPPKWFAGEILAISEARAALDRGEYDLVLLPPVPGRSPTTRNLASPKETTVVLWLDGADGLETEFLGEHALVSVEGLTHLYIGIARGPQVESIRRAEVPGGPAFLPTGDPTDGLPALDLLSTRPSERRDLIQTRLCQRLASAETSPGVAAGLAAHFAAQVPSSPFQAPELGIELVDEAAQRFSEAAAGETLDSLEIQLIETLGYLYTAQRKVEEIDRYLVKPAERHAIWSTLELYLAQAALEFLDPETALESLQRAHEAWPGSPTSWAMQAEAEQQSGDDRAAVASLERALTMNPKSFELERRLAIALQRAGDPRGKQAIEKALAGHPEDTSLQDHRGGGPYPPVPDGFHALGLDEHAGHDH